MKETVATTQTTGTEVSRMNQEVIKTQLIGKEEVFKILAIGKAMGTPILLIGQPGVSKTACVLDYAKANYGGDYAKMMQEAFILETDEGTKSSEVKGTLDIEQLVMDNKYAINAPITSAKYVVINEVDKASSGLRNALMGIMNEHILFSGKEKVPCEWNTFVATCNEIPKEEIKSPFWDRFLIKHTVERVTAAQMLKYFKNGDKDFHLEIKQNCPTEDQVKAVNVPHEKLEIFMGSVRNRITDRTLTFVPKLTRVISLIYGIGIDSALVKAAVMLTGDTSLGKELDKKLAPAEKRAVLDKIDLLSGIQDEGQLQSATTEIENLVNKYEKAGKLTEQDIAEITKVIEDVMRTHPIVNFQGID